MKSLENSVRLQASMPNIGGVSLGHPPYVELNRLWASPVLNRGGVSLGDPPYVELRSRYSYGFRDIP